MQTTTAVDQTGKAIRETTKWIVASTIALLALIAGVIPFSSSNTHALGGWRIITVVTGGALLLVAILWVLYASVAVLRPTPQTLREVLVFIDERPGARETADLLRSIQDNRYYLLRSSAPNIRMLWRQARTFSAEMGEDVLNRIEASERRIVAYVDYRVTTARYLKLIATLRMAVPLMVAGSLAVGLAVGLDFPRPITPLRAPLTVTLVSPSAGLSRSSACGQQSAGDATILASNPDFSTYIASIPRTRTCPSRVLKLYSSSTPFEVQMEPRVFAFRG